MPFLESPRFPEEVSFWMRGGPLYSTTTVQVNSGAESRNINWNVGLSSFEVFDGLRTTANIAATIAFNRVVKGMGYGFRVKDFKDYQDAANGILGTIGAGNGTPTYQLYKNYISGIMTDQRKIVKPVVGALVARNGATVTYGAVAGNCSLDTTTGLVTFVADASSAAASITPGTQTVLTTTTNPGTLIAGQLLYLSRFTGADAALVNGIAHSIVSVTGAGPFTFTLATNTLGKAITVGNGLSAKYPQASEPLTWTGEFDIPCRFNSDLMKSMGMDQSGALFTMGAVTLIEYRL